MTCDISPVAIPCINLEATWWLSLQLGHRQLRQALGWNGCCVTFFIVSIYHIHHLIFSLPDSKHICTSFLDFVEERSGSLECSRVEQNDRMVHQEKPQQSFHCSRPINRQWTCYVSKLSKIQWVFTWAQVKWLSSKDQKELHTIVGSINKHNYHGRYQRDFLEIWKYMYHITQSFHSRKFTQMK